MKLSVISCVLNSAEVVRRQILHYSRMNLSSRDVEVIFMDDGSHPPLSTSVESNGFLIYETNDKRPWTEHIARNRGVELAFGDYVCLIDIDYILPKESIESILQFNGDKMTFKRKFGTLDENGEIDDSRETLLHYGLKPRWLRKEYTSHRSQYVMRRDLFKQIGGYREDLSGKAHPKGGGAGQKFFHKWQRLERDGKVTTAEHRPLIYMFPVGKYCGHHDYNPFGLFHDLKRL